jgi:hypothetical protein
MEGDRAFAGFKTVPLPNPGVPDSHETRRAACEPAVPLFNPALRPFKQNQQQEYA